MKDLIHAGSYHTLAKAHKRDKYEGHQKRQFILSYVIENGNDIILVFPTLNPVAYVYKVVLEV